MLKKIQNFSAELLTWTFKTDLTFCMLREHQTNLNFWMITFTVNLEKPSLSRNVVIGNMIVPIKVMRNDVVSV